MKARDRELAQKLGGNLKRLRMAAGMHQEALGERAKCGKAMVCQVETGQRLPSIPLLLRLSTALGAQPGDLLAPVRQ